MPEGEQRWLWFMVWRPTTARTSDSPKTDDLTAHRVLLVYQRHKDIVLAPSFFRAFPLALTAFKRGVAWRRRVKWPGVCSLKSVERAAEGFP